jgi:16S rRNA (guanine527-N7)-methyltransferase
MSPEAILESGLAALDISLPLDVRRKLMDYLELLAKWNKVHNLTAVRELEDMVTLHLLDSLSILKLLNSQFVLDVGSGAGLPGIPIALVRPDVKMTVLDSSNKKAAFLRQAKAELDIGNLEVVCKRVEDYQPEMKFQTIISRAFSDLSELVRLTRHLLAEDGSWMAMKGVYPYDELEQIKSMHTQVLPISVPGLDAQRHLVLIQA